MNLDQPRYDQSTYLGRLKHFSELTDPRNLLATEKDLQNAKQLIADYKAGIVTGVPDEKLWKSKKLVESTYHSDTGEKGWSDVEC